MSTEQALPFDLAAEMAVVGAIPQEGSILAGVLATGLRAEHFYSSEHAAIFEAERALIESGRSHADGPIETALLRAELRAMGRDDLADGAGAGLIYELGGQIQSMTNACYCAELVRNLARRRELILETEQKRAALYDRKTPLSEIDAAARAEVYLVEDAATFQGAAAPALEREIIFGMLRQACKMGLIGPSKTNKTHFIMQLCLCAAVGVKFLGWTVSKGAIVFINPELPRASFYRRLNRIAEALDVHIPAGAFRVLHLRGRCAGVEQFVDLLVELAKQTPGGIQLFAFDSIYKLIGNRTENDAAQMTDFMNCLDVLAQRTGAAVIFSHHYAKGFAGAKASIDRGSGSGVLSRDPDAILTLTPHANDGVFVLDLTLRDFAPVDPFCVIQKYPLIYRAPEFDPGNLRRPGGAKELTLSDVERAFQDRDAAELERGDLVLAVKDQTGRGDNAITSYIASLVRNGGLITNKVERPNVRPKVLYALAVVPEAVSDGGYK